MPLSRAGALEQIAAAALRMRGADVSPLVYRPSDRTGLGCALVLRLRGEPAWGVVAVEEGRAAREQARTRAKALVESFIVEYRLPPVAARAGIAVVEFTSPSTVRVGYGLDESPASQHEAGCQQHLKGD